MTLEWVFHRLVRCQIRRHGEGKGTWRRDTERGGTRTWRPLPGEAMSPVPEAISVGSFSSLNLCGDPRRAVWNRTFRCCPATLGLVGTVQAVATKKEGSTSWSNGPRCWLERGRCMRPPCTTTTRACGPARGPPPPPLEVKPCPLPRPHQCHGGSCGGLNGLHTISDSDGRCPRADTSNGFEVCLFAC